MLSRYVDTTRRFGAASVVRLTADCPLIDPLLIDAAVHRFAQTGCDYLSNMLHPSYPYGLAVEVMTAQALLAAGAEAVDPQEREHVTPFIYWRAERFRLESMTRTPDLSHHRWTVDTPQDFDLVSRILSVLYPRKPDFGMADVLAMLDEHPDWVKINADVAQKTARRSTQDTP